MSVVSGHFKYVDTIRDRYGKPRYYFRRPKGPRIRLPGFPGSPEFIDAYLAALGGSPPPKGIKGRLDRGTFNRLAAEYFASSNFQRLRPITQAGYRAIIERFCEEHGHRKVAELSRDLVIKLVGAKASTPGAANDFLAKLRVLVRFAIDMGWRADDPTARIKKFPAGEHHTWTEEEIARFEEYWPLGSRQRTAFALHLYTGQRRSDVYRMTWADFDGATIRVVQQKTGTKLSIAAHRDLLVALDAWPRKHVAIITHSSGKPYTLESYGNIWALWIEAAGLPARCVLHGLRKAAARRLAEVGCSANEIAAITGHKTLAEVERYTKAANQERLARAAVTKQERDTR